MAASNDIQTVQTLLDSFAKTASNPAAALASYKEAGRRVIGVVPYYAPEEIVYAAGGITFGVWGRQGTAVEARKYFPPFYCSIAQMTLEMGLTGQLDGLDGIMIPACCDTLKCLTQNWRAGVPRIPMIFVSQAMNRFIPAGKAYMVESYREIAREVERCCGALVTDDGLRAAIALFNSWRAEMRRFILMAASHPSEVSFAAREAVVAAGYFMDKAEHLARVRELNDALAVLPESLGKKTPVVLSGIYADIPAIVSMLDELGYAVVGDDLAKESRAFALEVPEADAADPFEALAQGFCNLEGDSLLYDPKKVHFTKVVDLCRATQARGMILLLAKFCDPEEFDAPLLAREVRAAGIPVVQIEVDQSTESYEQARTQLETFKDLL